MLRWLTDVDGLLRFERSYFGRVAAYADKVGNLVKARTIDPGEWIEEYADFLTRVVDDLGDWMLEGEPNLTRAEPSVPFYEAKLRRSEGTVSIDLRIPPAAFEGRRGRDPEVTLVTEDLRVRGGGANLPRSRIAFVPENVKRSEPRAELKIFDVRNVVASDAVYRGTVWTKHDERVVAAIEVKVL